MFDQQTMIIIYAVGGSILIAILLFFLILFYIRIRKAKKNIVDQPVVVKDENSWSHSLGGKENIKEVEVKGSRLIVYLNDNEKFDQEAIHALGVTSVIKSENKITLVLKSDAQEVAELLK